LVGRQRLRALCAPYSLCDGLSMVICREREITRVLTADGDVVAEGSEALLSP